MRYIHKEGRKILFSGFVLLAMINFVTVFTVSDLSITRWVVASVSILFFVFLLFFFRVPKRELEPVSDQIYAPADGKVVVIEATEEKEYFKDKRLQISIFMSPLNMHSNKYPVSGKIKFINYHPGNKMVAWNPKSSSLNERSTVVIETVSGTEILVRQIAGAVARRIVTYSELGADVVQGDELGFIKFGSRVDIFLPEGTMIKVDMFQKVKANKTVIAELG
jgi:phosphatidylserine decarboxylase